MTEKPEVRVIADNLHRIAPEGDRLYEATGIWDALVAYWSNRAGGTVNQNKVMEDKREQSICSVPFDTPPLGAEFFDGVGPMFKREPNVDVSFKVPDIGPKIDYADYQSYILNRLAIIVEELYDMCDLSIFTEKECDKIGKITDKLSKIRQAPRGS